jgi:hypothetical protein
VSLPYPLFATSSLTAIIDENDDTLRFFIYEEDTACTVSFICPRYTNVTLEGIGAARHVVAISLHFSAFSVDYAGIQHHISSLSFLRSVFASFQECSLMLKVVPMWRTLQRPGITFQHACPFPATGVPEESSHTMPAHQDGAFLWELINFDGTTASSTGLLNLRYALIYLKQQLGITYQTYEDMMVELFKNQSLCFKATRDILLKRIYDIPLRSSEVSVTTLMYVLYLRYGYNRYSIIVARLYLNYT